MYDLKTSSEIEELFQTKKEVKGKKVTFPLIKQIRENKVPKSVFAKLSEILHISHGELASLIDISERTLSRRKKYLQKNEADKLYRVAHILGIAMSVLGDKEQAVFWLTTPKIALSNKAPLTFLDTELGANEIEDMLMRIEYGVYM